MKLGLLTLAMVLSACSQAVQSFNTPTILARTAAAPTLTIPPQVLPGSTATAPRAFQQELSTPTPRSPTRTHAPSATPVSPGTSTPGPTLAAHRWQPNAALILFDMRGGDGCCDYPLPPKLIVYADGRVFMQRNKAVGSTYRIEILTARLERHEICNLLNTIDQAGFFDYDPATYSSNPEQIPADGAPTYVIEVNAWRTKAIELVALGTFARGETQFTEPTPVVLPALRQTYLLLSGYMPTKVEPVRPDRLGLWIDSPEIGGSGEPWPLPDASLADLYTASRANNPPYPGNSVVLRGQDAEVVYSKFDRSIEYFGLRFEDRGVAYTVFARPLLPYEAPPLANERFALIPSAVFPTPAWSLSCEPSDGVAAIPVP